MSARAKPKPDAAALRASLADWIVTARHLVHRIRVEAEELLNERDDAGSPLADLLDQEQLEGVAQAMLDAESQFAGLIAPGPPVALPSPSSVLSRMRRG